MAKRGGSELTHDNWDQEDEREDAGTFKKATEGDMKSRVIKRARRRNVGDDGGEKKNVFAAFGGFAAKPDATQAFSFLSKPTEADKAPTGGFVFGTGATSAAATKPAVSSGFSFGSASSGPAKPSFGGFGIESKVDNTNPVFGSFTSEKSSPSNPPLFGSKTDSGSNSFGGFSFGAKKDATPEPSKKNDDMAPKSDFSSFKPPPGWSCSTCMVNNPVDKTSCLACATPKPGTKSEEKAVPSFGSTAVGSFKFGSETSVKTDAGSGSGLFSFGSASSNKLGSTSQEKKIDSTEGLAFGSKGSDKSTDSGKFSFGDKTNAEKTEGSGFSFGSKPENTEKTSVPTGFSFGAKSDSSSSKATEAFSFGAKSDSGGKPVGGGFSFGTKPDSKTSEGGFSGDVPESAAVNSKSQSDVVSKSSSSVKLASADKPNNDGISPEYLSHLKALNLQVLSWLKKHIEANPLVILSPVFKDYESHLVEITNKYKDKVDLKSVTAFSEGSSSSTTTISPETDPTPIVDSAPLGQAAFGGPKTSSTSSTFTFGGSDKPVNSTAPFSFGTSQPAASSTFGSSGFGATGSGGGFSFGGGVLGSTSSTTAPAATTNKEDDDDEDQPPVVEVKQVEESDAIYDKKCKLFYKKDGNYVEKGVGMLYLKTVEGGKIQLLVRADTNLGNVLLNILLSPQIPTTRVGKNNVMLVCVPNPPVDPKADSSAPCPMLIRVKTGEDADELKAKLDELKEK